MRIESFDLSIDRTSKPEPSQVARSLSGGYVMVVRCDSPAMLRVDGSTSGPVIATPGLVLNNFTALWVSNAEGAGILTLAYYDCVPPGAPVGLSQYGAQVLASDSGAANAQLAGNVVTPDDVFGVALTGLTISSSDGADDSYATVEWRGKTFFTVFRGYLSNSESNLTQVFNPPLLLPLPDGETGQLEYDIQGGGAAAGIHAIQLYGFFYDART